MPVRIALSLSLFWLLSPYALRGGAADWTFLGPFGGDVQSLVSSPTNGTLWAGMNDGPLFRSSDGESWQLMPLSFMDILAVVADPADSMTTLASTGWGLFRSRDGGDTWNRLQDALPPSFFATHLQAAPFQSGVFYAVEGGHLIVSNDGGDSWQTILQNPQVGTIRRVLLDPLDPQRILLATTKGGVLVSDNAGGSWQGSNSGLPDLEVLALVRDDSTPGQIFASTAAGGVAVSHDNGLTWTDDSQGLAGQTIIAMAFADGPVRNLIAASRSQGVFRRPSDATSWTTPSVPPGPLATSALAVATAAEGVGSCVYLGTLIEAVGSLGGVWRSCDGGDGWLEVNEGLAGIHRISSLQQVSASGDILVGHEPGGVFRTVVESPSWQPSSGSQTDLPALALAEANDGTIWLGSDDRRVFRSTDGGGSWQLSTLLPAHIMRVDGVHPDPSALGTAIVRAGNDLQVTVDDGASWNSVGGDLPFVLPSSLAVSTSGVDEMQLGQRSGEGLWVTTNGGQAWTVDEVGLALDYTTDVVALAQNGSQPHRRYAVLWRDPAGGGADDPDLCEFYTATTTPAQWSRQLSEETECGGGLALAPDNPALVMMIFPNGVAQWSGSHGATFQELPLIRLGPLTLAEFRQRMTVHEVLVREDDLLVGTNRGIFRLPRNVLGEQPFSDGFESGSIGAWSNASGPIE